MNNHVVVIRMTLVSKFCIHAVQNIDIRIFSVEFQDELYNFSICV